MLLSFCSSVNKLFNYLRVSLFLSFFYIHVVILCHSVMHNNGTFIINFLGLRMILSAVLVPYGSIVQNVCWVPTGHRNRRMFVNLREENSLFSKIDK